MATLNYSKVAANASKAIRQVGSELTFSYKTGGVKDAVKGTVTAAQVNTYKAWAMLSNINKFGIDTFGSANIKTGDMMLYIEVTKDQAVEPDAGHTVLSGSHSFNLIQVASIAPAGKPVLYIAQVRR